ncbi:MAG: hypothetical protein SAK29_36835 [Scytonema sp. PMC 1069.18]|nr:hypothetical protein [Scytonema sp. PMC 1069.18]MEC4887518.1 hypothetical protein [Scytonema sp. PMC 1070.18]
MVQQPRRDEPLYCCIVPVESITGNLEEELTTFGTSADAARLQAQQMLASSYECNEEQIQQLMGQARTEYVSPWCSPN